MYVLFLSIGLSTPIAQAKVDFEAIKISLNPPVNFNDPKVTPSFEIKPTEYKKGQLRIKNSSTSTDTKLKIYAVDGLASNDGTAAFKLKDTNQEHVGTWIKFTKNEYTIKANSQLILPYVITIPEKVTPGTYQGGLIAEVVNATNPVQPQVDQIKIQARIVEPIIISVPGRKIAKYDFTPFSEQSINGRPQINYGLNNSGNIFLKTTGNITITGTLLKTPYEADLGHPQILQDDTLQDNFTWANPPLFGHYQATINFQINEYNVANGELKLLKTISQQIDFNIIPWYHIFGILILIILICGTIYYFREQNRLEQATLFLHKVKKGETINAIAELYKVDWKKIAHLNKLDEPYTLRTGRTIFLPLPKSPDKLIDKRKK